MEQWPDELRVRVLTFLRLLSEECKRCLRAESVACEECWARGAKALLSDLSPRGALPEREELDDSPGGWTYGEDRLARRRALVAQLMAEPSHRLPASRISIPGIATRTALLRWLARQVRAGFLAYDVAKSSGGRPARVYRINRPAPR